MTRTEWLLDMIQAWEDDELEFRFPDGRWRPWPVACGRPMLCNTPEYYRRKPRTEPQVGDVWDDGDGRHWIYAIEDELALAISADVSGGLTQYNTGYGLDQFGHEDDTLLANTHDLAEAIALLRGE